MTKPTKLNIISKLNNFSNIQVGEAPTTFYDDNMYPLLYNKYGAVSLQKNDETYLSFTNDTAKLSYMQVIDSIKTKNFQLDCTILLTQIRAENILYAFVQGINNLFFKISIKNTFRDGIIITSNNMAISANYKFEVDKKYNISVSKEDDTYTFYINGISHGYKISPVFTNNIMIGQNLTFGSNTGTTNTSTSNFRGNLYNLNISYGVTLINYKSYTKYGNHLISRQYFGNHNSVDTATLFYCNTETINESPIVWEIPQINNKEEYAVLNNSLFKTNLSGPYTITFNLKPNNVSQTSNLFTYNNYRIILNIVPVSRVSPDPDVTVNEYTTSALNFENGLVDQIGTTVWTKEGTSDITSVNKIFGKNSFETKSLGDSLSTTNAVITGGATPFTIEFYALIKGSSKNSSGYPEFTYPLISKNNNSGGGEQSFSIMNNMNPVIFRNSAFAPFSNVSGNYKFRLNEINKNQIVYDGAAIRWFINDELAVTVGTLKGFRMDASTPFTFYNHTIPSYPEYNTQTKGIIDNVNIFDGIATKVRDHDPYEEFLVVDLALDGENNSTKIVDNGNGGNTWTVYGNAKISTDQKFDGFSSLYLNGSSSIYTQTTDNHVSFNRNSIFTMSFDYICTVADTSTKVLVQFFNNSSQRISLYMHSLKNLKLYYSGALRFDINIPTIEVNKPVNYRFIWDKGTIYLYINNVLVHSYYENYDMLDGYPFRIYLGESGTSSEFFYGYIKNFKIYKGVAVIPEDPTGKIRLDFDNNVVDKYNNSTWSNNGVTFDQVNSVKGHAAKFNGSNSILSISNNQNLNFENKNFVLSYDFKNAIFDSVNNRYLFGNGMALAHGAVWRLFGTSSSKSGSVNLNYNSTNYGLTHTVEVENNYYNEKILRNSDTLVGFKNDVAISALNVISAFNVDFKNMSIGTASSLTAGVSYFNGYLDNFKTYKEDLINIKLDQYGTNATTSVSNEILKINFNSAGNGSYHTFKFKDVPILKNFIAEIETIVTAGNTNYTSIVFRTSDYSLNNMDKFGYVAYITGNLIRFGKGGNNNTANWVKLGEYVLTTQMADGNVHKLKVIANDSNFKIYYDDYLIIDVNDTSYTNASPIGHVFYNFIAGLNPNIKSLALSDLNNNLIYSNNFKSKIDNAIDRPAVHLPLETNAINTGFTPLTINSVGSPTYTTIDGKKCIKFESGKYLSINSNNIFNLGTSSDFYIEFDFYPTQFTGTSGMGLFGNFVNSSGSVTNNSTYVEIRGTSDTTNHKKVMVYYRKDSSNIYNKYASSNEVSFNQFNSLIIKRKNDNLSIILNDIEIMYPNVIIPLDFSANNTVLGQLLGNNNANLNGYMSNFKMFVGTSEIPETYNDKKVLDLDFKPTRKSYLFKDNNNKCVIHPVNITQRDYQDSQYCCAFNGTDQYLQLGKNDLLNFGFDDFIINIKFKINNFNNNWQSLISCGKNDSVDSNKTAISINNNKIWVLTKNSFFSVKDLVLNSNTYYNLVVYRENTKYYLKLNDVDYVLEPNAISDNRTELTDYNYNNNTIIGANLWDGAGGYFNGTIYSIKVLRNTTDLSLLEDENTNVIVDETEVSYTLSNGFDEVSISKDTLNENFIQIAKSDDKVVAIIDDEILEVPTTAGNVDTNDLYLFNEYKGNIKDLRVYNKAFYDKDVFEYDGPYDTELGLIDTLDNEYDEYIMVDQGDYIIKGYFEGIAEAHKWRIYNSINYNVLISGTSINYYYDGVDHLYKDDYKILDMVTNKTYDIVDMGPPGSIKVFINSKVCTGSNFVIRAYRRDSGVFIGEYELDKTRDPYECTIHNLDTTKTYDIMLFDKNNNIESRVMSNRSPEAY